MKTVGPLSQVVILGDQLPGLASCPSVPRHKKLAVVGWKRMDKKGNDMKHRPWKCRETSDNIHYIFQILSVAVVVSLLNEVFAQSSKVGPAARCEGCNCRQGTEQDDSMATDSISSSPKGMESNGKFRNERGRIQELKNWDDWHLLYLGPVTDWPRRILGFAVCNTENTVAKNTSHSVPSVPVSPCCLQKTRAVAGGSAAAAGVWPFCFATGPVGSVTRGTSWHFVGSMWFPVLACLSMSSHVLATSLLVISWLLHCESSTLHHSTMPHRNTLHTLQDIVAVSTVITASEKCSQWKQELGIAASFAFRSSFLVFYINDQWSTISASYLCIFLILFSFSPFYLRYLSCSSNVIQM